MKKVAIIIFSVLAILQVVLSIMDFKYVYGGVGALALIILWIKKEKQRVDQGGKAHWSDYFLKEWDDYCFAWALTLIFVSLQEWAYFFLVAWMEWDFDHFLDMYYEGGQEIIAASLGFTSTILIHKLYRKADAFLEKKL